MGNFINIWGSSMASWQFLKLMCSLASEFGRSFFLLLRIDFLKFQLWRPQNLSANRMNRQATCLQGPLFLCRRDLQKALFRTLSPWLSIVQLFLMSRAWSTQAMACDSWLSVPDEMNMAIDD